MAKHSLYCDDCRVEIFVDLNMVILHDELWEKVSGGKVNDAYCDCCIEKRLGRPIAESDLRPSSVPIFTHIPCNAMWLEEKRSLRDRQTNG